MKLWVAVTITAVGHVIGRCWLCEGGRERWRVGVRLVRKALGRKVQLLWAPPVTVASAQQGTVALIDRRRLGTDRVTAPGTSSIFAGFRFPPEVISVAVRWYLPYGLSYRDAGELPPTAASPLLMSPPAGGCSGSRRSSSRPLARAATVRVTGRSPVRRT